VSHDPNGLVWREPLDGANSLPGRGAKGPLDRFGRLEKVQEDALEAGLTFRGEESVPDVGDELPNLQAHVESHLFLNFSNGRLFGGLTWLMLAFGDLPRGPAASGHLNQCEPRDAIFAPDHGDASRGVLFIEFRVEVEGVTEWARIHLIQSGGGVSMEPNLLTPSPRGVDTQHPW